MSPSEFMTAGRPDGRALAWLEGLLVELGAARQGRKWQCPGHGLRGEHSASLSLRADDLGRVLVWCHAGCSWVDILDSLCLTGAALRYAPPATPQAHAAAFLPGVKFPPLKNVGGSSLADRGFKFEAAHEYGDPVTWAWKMRHRHASGAKEIRWDSTNPDGLRVPGLLGRREADMPLYRQRDLKMAIAATEVVLLCESESSVDALVKAGWYATCWAGGAGSCPIDQIRSVLGEARVVFLPDFDDAGLDVAERICKALPAVSVLLGDPGEDARDLLKRLGGAEFRRCIQEACVDLRGE
jgi:hypothetical protein